MRTEGMKYRPYRSNSMSHTVPSVAVPCKLSGPCWKSLQP